MAESDERALAIRSTDGAVSFTVTNLKIDKGPGLSVEPNPEPGEDPDGATCIVVASGVKFSATVTATGAAPPGAWMAGWIQTLYRCSQSVTYQSPGGAARGKMVSALDRPRADGDSSQDEHWAWYESPGDCAPGVPATVKLKDEPNTPFHPQYDGQAAPWITGWNAVAVAGTMPFCSWLVAEHTGTKEIVYLHHIAWTVDFGVTLSGGKLSGAPAGGTVITSQGPGKGGQEPCLEPEAIEAESYPFEPDADLRRLKPA